MTAPSPAAVMIGASAGAVEALSTILPGLPADFPRPVIVIVHVPPDRRSVMAPIFDQKCRMRAVEPEDKEPIRPGTIYFAPPDYHLLIEREGTIALSNEELVFFSRPSIDVSLESGADAWGAALTAIILSGANQDGALGLRAVCDVGGTAIVQDPREAYAAAMPEAAARLCPEARIMTLEGIEAYLQGMTQ